MKITPSRRVAQPLKYCLLLADIAPVRNTAAMIADTLIQCHRYANLSPHFAAAFAFLEKLPADISAGRHDIDGDNCFALVQSYTTKPLAQAKFEAHRKYIDIQFIQAGSETLLWAPLAALVQVTEPYLAEKDVAFFASPNHFTPINLRAGEFTIFFPTDGHAPSIENGGPSEVRKTVIKVCVSNKTRGDQEI